MFSYGRKEGAINLLKKAFGEEWNVHFSIGFAGWCEYTAKKGYSIGYINSYLNGILSPRDEHARFLSDNVYKWLKEYIKVKTKENNNGR